MQDAGRNAPGGENRIITESGQALITMVSSSNNSTLYLRPDAVNARIAVLSTTYQLFRFTWLKIVAHPVAAAGVEYAIGFTPDTPDSLALPSSFAEVFEMPYALYMSPAYIAPRYIEIPARGMIPRNATKWFETDVVTEAQMGNQGALYIRTAGATTSVNLELQYKCQFTNPLPVDLTIARYEAMRLRNGAIADEIRERVASESNRVTKVDAGHANPDSGAGQVSVISSADRHVGYLPLNMGGRSRAAASSAKV